MKYFSEALLVIFILEVMFCMCIFLLNGGDAEVGYFWGYFWGFFFFFFFFFFFVVILLSELSGANLISLKLLIGFLFLNRACSVKIH